PEPLIFDASRPGREGVPVPRSTVPETPIPADWVRGAPALPEVAEVDVMRHYVRLSHLNYSVDTGFYPLGSCTMKYNPRVNEAAARLGGFAGLHPLVDERDAQGALALMYDLQRMLAEIGGFAAVSLQPAAGAHGELTGIFILRKRLADLGQGHRTRILVPDSAHGTNPASTAMAGFEAVQIPSDARGNVDLAKLKAALDERTAGLMLTNPNTLGLFEERLEEVTGLVHAAGGLVYGDGANFNALLGVCRPGELGIDVMHFNLHKTFSTPHGGGGPGSGAVGVSAELAPYLPAPVVERRQGADPEYRWAVPAKTIGRVKAFHGNFGILVRAYAYIRSLGPDGLRAVAENAVLNANYLLKKLHGAYPVPYAHRVCMHEFVAQGKFDAAPDVRALDVSKRLIDKGFHPPTNYFPLIVPEALMIEPTETESRETLDRFAEAMLEIAREAVSDPALLHDAPHDAPVKRLDEVKAARELKVTA
ncbi:MAG TPA: aminomethyl-transferring glycine dehydrogenase subunit GcvPB, partial [Desulfobacterales bacterium]|nr:aminomethyl-transferring glycine dehydrogenase subunit GcvPB [Desulfobacterales bacterium]